MKSTKNNLKHKDLSQMKSLVHGYRTSKLDNPAGAECVGISRILSLFQTIQRSELLQVGESKMGRAGNYELLVCNTLVVGVRHDQGK